MFSKSTLGFLTLWDYLQYNVKSFRCHFESTFIFFQVKCFTNYCALSTIFVQKVESVVFQEWHGLENFAPMLLPALFIYSQCFPSEQRDYSVCETFITA